MPLRHSLLAVLVMIIWGVNFLAIDFGSTTYRPCCSSRSASSWC
ncbi:hypothetical protein [Promicromonospora sp. NPDC023805]